MAGITSNYWDWSSGICFKHRNISILPCPTCYRLLDKDIKVVISTSKDDLEIPVGFENHAIISI